MHNGMIENHEELLRAFTAPGCQLHEVGYGRVTKNSRKDTLNRGGHGGKIKKREKTTHRQYHRACNNVAFSATTE
jgi:hypothetical protein